MRQLSGKALEDAFSDVVMSGDWQEQRSSYPRYRSRYEAVVRCYATVAPAPPVDVLEIDGGQLRTLSARLWADRAGFHKIDVTLHEFSRAPGRRGDRLLAALGKPLVVVPRFRDNLLVTAVAP